MRKRFLLFHLQLVPYLVELHERTLVFVLVEETSYELPGLSCLLNIIPQGLNFPLIWFNLLLD